MELPESFLSIDTQSCKKCFLCEKTINLNDKTKSIAEKSWDNFKRQAKEWSILDVSTEDELYHFTQLYIRIKDHPKPIGRFHENCRIKFGTRIERYKQKYKAKQVQNEPQTEQTLVVHSSNIRKSNRGSIDKSLCFVCQEKRTVDNTPYNNGGIGRCETVSAAEKLHTRTTLYIKNSEHRFHAAAKRFQLLGSGQSFDNFAIDVYYHKSCYISYAIKPLSTDTSNVTCEKEHNVIEDFFSNIRIKIVRNKEAHLLHNLLSYVKELSEICGIPPVFEHTSELKRKLKEEFTDQIDFFPISKYVIVHASNMNPCQYSVSTLLGKGLRDKDYINSFSNFIRTKISKTDPVIDNFEPEQIIDSLNEGPLPELFNTIFATKYGPNFKTNDHGYAVTSSSNIANKIWSIASDWHAFISSSSTPKQKVLSLVLHRMTGSKEAVNYVHKLGHGISYNRVSEINDTWSRSSTKYDNVFLKGLPLHSTIDNNDGRQDTITGSGTTHHTNCTFFQPMLKNDLENHTDKLNIEIDDNEDFNNIPSYNIPKYARSEPPPFSEFIDNESTSQLDTCFSKNVAWSMANGVPENSTDNLPLLGSWTAFQKCVTSTMQSKSIIEYLPVIGQPPSYDVCKKYLDGLNNIAKDLQLDHLFTHADEDVYARLVHIIWKHGNLYKKIITLMGGFHQLRVRQRLISKRHTVMGYKNWFVDAGVIAPGSVDAAFNGKHYYRCMRLLKEAFDALTQFRIETLTENYEKVDSDLIDALKNLRRNPSPDSINFILSNQSFRTLVSSIKTTKGKQDAMVVAFLQDVSSLLALVSSVREGDVERHLEAERDMIKQAFSFDHQNYSRYLTYQHVLLNDHKKKNSDAFRDLVLRGFGASYSTNSFSTVHGDLVTEYFNRETKVSTGPFRLGFSTDLCKTNKWVKNIHIHAKLRMALREKVNLKVSSTHKEITDSGKKTHHSHVNSLKKKLYDYGTDPFNDGLAKEFTSGCELSETIIDGLLKAPETGNKRFKEFVKLRLVDKTVSFFEPISKLKLETGIKKTKKTPRVMSILKEDTQAFGVLCAKAVSLKEAFTFPITSIPFSLGYPEGSLRQSDKANFRNWLIDQTPISKGDKPPDNARWIYDGMALFRQLKPLKTYKEFFKYLIKIAIPTLVKPLQIEIVNDVYLKQSTKDDTRSNRAKSNESRRIYLSGFDQLMPQGEQWSDFFNNKENKEDLIALAISFFKSEEGRRLLKYPLVINSKNITWKLTQRTVEEIEHCNHEEADYRMIYHAGKTNTKAVIVSKDTDVLVLMMYAMTLKPHAEWYFQNNPSNFVNVRMLCNHFGHEICTLLPQFHAITGCDTTAYRFSTGKLKVFKKFFKNPQSWELLKPLGKNKILTQNDYELLISFIQTILYNGKSTESYVDTRVRLYQNLKKKSSAAIPADPDSNIQEIKRCHFQSYIWLRCLEPIIPSLDFTKYGWLVNDQNQIKPIWFVGYQFPLSLRRPQRGKKRNIRAKNENNASDADLESSADADNIMVPTKKKRTVAVVEKGIQNNAYEDDQLADNETEVSAVNESSSEFESDFSSSDSIDTSDSDFEP